jgi:hypothetical protein
MDLKKSAPLNVLQSTGVPLYAHVICSKTYHSYVKPQIIPNAIYNIIFMYYT